MTIWTELLGSKIHNLGNGWQTRILDRGEGEPVLLLHGQGGSLENFRHNIPAYAEEYRVVAMDLLWHGRSATPPIDPALIPAWVRQVSDVIETLGLGPCHIEGQSLGGWVAATLSLQRPEIVRSLVLTTPMGLDPQTSTADPQVLKRVLDAQLTALDDLSSDSVRARINTLFKDETLIDDEIVELRQKLYAQPATNAALREVARAYFAGAEVQAHRLGPADLERLAVPTLVYWGTANIGGPEAGKALANAIPNAEYHCADVGHWAQYERFDEHNEIVLEFFRRHSEQAPGRQ